MEALFDADGHLFEKEAEIFEYLEPPFHGRKELLRSFLFPPMDSWNRTALSIAGGYLEGLHSGRPREEGTTQQWIDFLDEAGIESTVLYPTLGLGFSQIKEIEWGIALAKAYNTWLYEKFTRVNPRLKGMALIPMQNPEAAVKELQRAANQLGMLGGVIIAGGRRPLGDPFYYPIYDAAQKLDTVLAIHASGPGNRLEMLSRAIEARCLGHPTSLMIEMTSMMFHGVFDLFPRLRFAFLEGGAAWVLFLLERMQEAYEQWAVQAPELQRQPKEHLTSGRLFFHTNLEEDILPFAVQELGDQVLLYASDYPHLARGKILNTLRRFQQRRDLSAEAKTRILGDNARRLYKLRQSSGTPVTRL